MEWRKGEFIITTNQARFDVATIHQFLTTSYWAAGIPRDVVEKSIENSIGFAILQDEALVGFARVITDKATYAYLADVFVIEAARGQGLSKWLMEVIVTYPELQGIRSFFLQTGDAHGLYRQFGWEVFGSPDKVMKRSAFKGYGSE